MEDKTMPYPYPQSSPVRTSIRRVPLACIQCRSRKVRCDASQPCCTRCSVDGKQCEYQKSRRGGRPRRPDPVPVPVPVPMHIAVGDSPSTELSSQWTEVFGTTIDSNSSSGFGSAGSSSQSISDTLEIGSNVGSSSFDPAHLTSMQVDQLLTQYYIYFHVAHPCVLPQWSLRSRLAGNPAAAEVLLPVLLYIGSLFTHSVRSAPLADAAKQAIDQARTRPGPPSPYYVQALTLYCIAVYWCNEPERGRALLDDAIRGALDLGMHTAEFASENGHGDAVLEESWRRTWWSIYVTDAHIAGSTHTYPTQTGRIQTSAELPCEEHLYESGTVPPPATLRNYNMREFSDVEFSSFAHLIGFTQILNRVLATRRHKDIENAKIICANADTAMTAWCSLLPASKRRLLRDDGSVDELLFKANILMHVYVVDLHRELSSLKYSAIEAVSKCAPPAPPESNDSIKEDAHIHTAKALFAVEKLHGLLTLPTNLTTHTPFIICMISNMTIAHLSACRYIFKEPRLALERDKIRLNMGVLKMMGDFWPAGAREYHDVGIIAREILALADDEISIPKLTPVLPLDTLDFNDFDINWACDVFGTGADAGAGAEAPFFDTQLALL